MTSLASGIILYRRGTPSQSLRVLLLRNRRSGHWGFPKGRRDSLDPHEVATALRELAEETGYTGIALHPGFRAEIDYLVRQGEDEPYAKRVVYFLAEAPAAEPVLSPEHDAALWADATTAAARLQFGQLRDLLRAALLTLDGA